MDIKEKMIKFNSSIIIIITQLPNLAMMAANGKETKALSNFKGDKSSQKCIKIRGEIYSTFIVPVTLNMNFSKIVNTNPIKIKHFHILCANK